MGVLETQKSCSYLFVVISRVSYYVIYCTLVTFLEHSIASVYCMTFLSALFFFFYLQRLFSLAR